MHSILRAALLWLLLAFPANAAVLQTNGTPCPSGSASFSINIIATQPGASNSPATTPLTILCVPSEAAQAGFTTLAANYDFSQPTYATQANWLDTGHNQPTYTWHCGASGHVPLLPCNINQVVDPDTGQTVMHLQWLTSYSSFGYSGNNNNMGMSTEYDTTSHYNDFPNMYIETVQKMKGLYSGSPTDKSGPIDVFLWQTDFFGSNQILEVDPVEEYGGQTTGFYDGAIHNWNGGDHGKFTWTTTSPNVPAGFGVTAYHKFGALITSDGASATYVCAYIDDVFQSCQTFSPPTPSADQFLQRYYPIIQLQSNVNGTGYPPVNQDQYVQYVRIWTCGSWALPAGTAPTAGTHCNRSTLVNGPPPALTYYH